MSGVDKEYSDMLIRSWSHPLEQVSHVIGKERKVSMKEHVEFHTRANHEYHMGKWGRCVYCDNHIPIREE